MASPFVCVLDSKSSLGECPVWSAHERVLYWVDINAPSLNRFDPATGGNVAMPMPESIGSFALRAGGGFIVALRGGIWLARADGKLERKILDAPYDPAHHRFNDGRCDPQGRFFAGTMNERRDAYSAELLRIDADCAMTRILADITISNGLAWSPDGRTMYWADTHAHVVWAFDFEPLGGAMTSRRVFAQFAPRPGQGLAGYGGRPDGAAVDAEGCYWVAMYEGARVLRLSPAGELLAEVHVPARCPTMPCFGDSDLKTIYVTSASLGRPPEERDQYPHAGCTFAFRVDVPGLPVRLMALA